MRRKEGPSVCPEESGGSPEPSLRNKNTQIVVVTQYINEQVLRSYI